MAMVPALLDDVALQGSEPIPAVLRIANAVPLTCHGAGCALYGRTCLHIGHGTWHRLRRKRTPFAVQTRSPATTAADRSGRDAVKVLAKGTDMLFPIEMTACCQTTAMPEALPVD